MLRFLRKLVKSRERSNMQRQQVITFIIITLCRCPVACFVFWLFVAPFFHRITGFSELWTIPVAITAVGIYTYLTPPFREKKPHPYVATFARYYGNDLIQVKHRRKKKPKSDLPVSSEPEPYKNSILEVWEKDDA